MPVAGLGDRSGLKADIGEVARSPLPVLWKAATGGANDEIFVVTFRDGAADVGVPGEREERQRRNGNE
jgi:hypothetical protein